MSGRIPQHFIDDLVARSDIVDVINPVVQLKRSGHEYKACCPFHDEKTPSFYVSPQKQFYHCFGCGVHGTALGFLMAYEHLEFPEAVEKLAAMHGIDVPREGGEAPKRKDPSLYQLLERVTVLYQDALKRHTPAQDYLKGRGLSGEIARDFRIGYAPEGWQTLNEQLAASRQDEEALVTAGMLIDKGGRSYDRFRDRIMFPIRDNRGRVIAFGGRVLGDGEPKYLNSPETPLFHKGRELYGLYEARQALREIPRLMVVEGYMDVVALAQHDIRYAVATLGTATTAEHLQRLFRITDEVVFCFDGDRAGRKAAWRGLEESLKVIREGRQVRFLFLPEGDDPDTLVRREGREGFEQRLADAEPASRFMEHALAEQVDMDSLDGRARFLELAKPLLGSIEPGVYREMLVEAFARRARTEVNTLRSSLGRAPIRGAPGRRRPTAAAPAHKGGPVRQAIHVLVHAPELGRLVGDTSALAAVDRPGVDLLLDLLDLARNRDRLTTAGVLEHYRDREETQQILLKLANKQLVIDEQRRSADDGVDLLEAEFPALIARIEALGTQDRLAALQAKAESGSLGPEEKKEYAALLQRTK